MVDVEATDHGSLVHVRKIVDYPWDASDFGADLCHNLANDVTQVPAIVDGAGEDGLGDNRDLLSQKLLQVGIQVRSALSSRKE